MNYFVVYHYSTCGGGFQAFGNRIVVGPAALNTLALEAIKDFLVDVVSPTVGRSKDGIFLHIIQLTALAEDVPDAVVPTISGLGRTTALDERLVNIGSTDSPSSQRNSWIDRLHRRLARGFF